MATMIPDYPPQGSPNEHKIYNILKDCPGTEDWIVLHNIVISEHVNQSEGEADFIIFIPNQPVIFAEVKGTVSHGQRGWSYDHGTTFTERSAQKQAKDAMASIRNWIYDQNHHIPHLPTIHCSMFVRTTWPHEKNLPDFLVRRNINESEISEADPEQLREAIYRVINQEIEDLRVRRNSTFDPSRVTEYAIQQWVDILKPYVPPIICINQILEDIERFTDEQSRALINCERYNQNLFQGLAGTGKTILAIQLACNKSTQGKNVLFLCFTKNTREKIKKRIGDKSDVHVKGIGMLAFHTIRTVLGGDEEDSWRERWNTNAIELEEVIKKAIELLPRIGINQKYDYLIVDEAQDIMGKSTHLQLASGWLKNGLQKGKWTFFFDENQLIFNHRHANLSEFQTAYPQASLKNLHTNCRNTESIAMFANRAGQLTDPNCYNEYDVRHQHQDFHPTPTCVYYTDSENQRSKVFNHISDLLDIHIKENQIVILSPKIDSCGLLLSRIHDNLFKPYALDVGDFVRFCTIHSFKGLESIAIIVTDIDQIPANDDFNNLRELLYTAATRAILNLTFFVSQDIKEEFDNYLQGNNGN